MSYRGEVQYIPNSFARYISSRSELSFKPLKVVLSASGGKKIDIIAEKMLFSGQNSKAPNSPSGMTYIGVFPLVDYYQNLLTRVHLIFWNKTPLPSWTFRVCGRRE